MPQDGWHPVVPLLRMTEHLPGTDILLLSKSQIELTIWLTTTVYADYRGT